MRGAKHVGNDGTPLSEAVKRLCAFNQCHNAFLGQLNDGGVKLARRLDVGGDVGRNDAVAVLRHDGDVSVGRLVRPLIVPLQNLPDKGTVGDHLRAPILGSQAGRENVGRGRVGLVESEAGRDPVHAGDAVGHQSHVLELLGFAGVVW